jgi:hypothetical protein
MGARICNRCLSIEISQHHVEVCQNRKPMSWHTDKLIADAAKPDNIPQKIPARPIETTKGKFENVAARAALLPQFRGK